MPVEIEMCEFYHVEMTEQGYKLLCQKGHSSSIKCHSKRPDCPDYAPSFALTREEMKARLEARNAVYQDLYAGLHLKSPN